MAVVDSSDNILKWENGDMVEPLSTKMNMHLDSVGLVTNKLNREGVYRVATIPARTALVTAVGTSNISAANPLIVWRANATTAQQLEYTTNGSTWHHIKTSQEPVDDTGWIPLTLNSPFVATNELERPSVRRIGKVVHMRGFLGNTGLTANGTFYWSTLPVGFAPPINYSYPASRQSGAAAPAVWFVNYADRRVSLRVGTSVAAYYGTAGITWTVD